MRRDVNPYRLSLVSTLAVVVTLAGLTWQRWQQPDMRRPLEHDEFITVELYTWAGLTPSGEGQRLRRVADLHQLPPPTPMQLGMGAYRSLGVWKEPNNHVWNSFLINFSTLRGSPTEAAVRLPALIGALVFAMSLYWFCHSILEWRWATPLVALWGFCCPFLIEYGQTARGYSWMIAFQPLLLGALCRQARNPNSLMWGLIAVVIAILSFINIISMAVDWLLPVYVALWLCPPRWVGAVMPPTRTFRISLLIQAVCVGLVGLVFLVDRLPFVYSSAQQYGLHILSLSGLWSTARDVFVHWFPSWPWMALAGVGCIGIFATLASPRYRFLGVIVLAIITFNALHFLLAKRAPYARGWGYYIPLFLIGTAYVVECAVRSLPRPAYRAGLWVCLAAASVVLISASNGRIPDNPQSAAIREMVANVKQESEPPTYIVLPTVRDYLMKKYLPAEWLDDEDDLAGVQKLRLLLLTEWHDAWCMKMSVGPFWETRLVPIDGQSAAATDNGRFQLVGIDVTAIPFTPQDPSLRPAFAFAIWYPDAKRSGLGSRDILDLLERTRVPYYRRDRKTFAKLDFYSELHSLELVSTNPAAWDEMASALAQGQKRFGGKVILFVSHEGVQKGK